MELVKLHGIDRQGGDQVGALEKTFPGLPGETVDEMSAEFDAGIVVGHYVSCHRKGIRLIAAGVGPRVRELFKMTKVDTTIPMTATVDEADINSSS
jgi:hypothetical protein